MQTKSLIALACVLTTLGLNAVAQTTPGSTDTPRVDKREAKQAARIEQGKANGTLTEKEAARLQRQQARVAKAEAKAKADNAVTARERAKLAEMQDKASRSIKRQKNDKQAAAS